MKTDAHVHWPLVALGLVLVSCSAPPGAERPTATEWLPAHPGFNVLVVSFDALRADALGVYGYPLATSPNIDRFAEQALVFERAYSAAPVTPTSFAAMFTGRLPSRSFRGWQLEPLATLAESFTGADYDTAAFLNNSQLTRERGFDSGFEHFEVFSAAPDRQVLEAATAWISEPRKQRFFAWVHFLSPHSPYDWRQGSTHLYDADYEGPFVTTTGAKFAPEEAVDRARLRSLYDGEVYFADQLFAELMEVLRQQDLERDTLIVLTADHGEEFAERGRFQHWSLHDEAVRVPLLIKLPRSLAGGRSNLPVSNLDLWPTLASLVGVEPPPAAGGIDLRLQSGAERSVVSVAMTDSKYRGVSLTKGGWRLILNCHPELALQLYHLAADPGEKEDLVASESRRARQLLQELGAILEGDPCQVVQAAIRGVDPAAGLSEETLAGLKALGYLE